MFIPSSLRHVSVCQTGVQTAVASRCRRRRKLPETKREIKIVVYFDTRGDVYFCNEDTQQQRLTSPPHVTHGLVILNVIEY